MLFKNEISQNLLFTIFRIIFGLLMIDQILGLFPFVYGLQNSHIVFHYPNFDFIEAYSILLIDILKYTSLAGIALFIYGKYIKTGAFLFLISFGYVFLIDMSFYNNHYYLWCLISILYLITDVNQSYTLIEIFKKNIQKREIPKITIFSFKLLISIVYFYAFVAKMNTDWLNGYPASLWLLEKNFPQPRILGLIMSYFGLIYDLSIPFLIWFYAKKWWLVLPYFTFHIANNFLFNIGIFPFAMMAVWLLFFIKDNDLKLIFVFHKKKQKIFNVLLMIFLIFNIVFPLRFLLVKGNVSWHRQGYYFSWRMMLDKYEVSKFNYVIVLPSKKTSYMVDFKKFVTFRQYVNFANDPYLIWYVAQKLKKDAEIKYGVLDARVYFESKVRLNNAEFKNLVYHDLDLTNSEYFLFKKNNFINY